MQDVRALTVAEVLREGPLDARERRILLAHVSGLTREDFARAPEMPLAAATIARYRALAARRAEGEPIAYLVATRAFYGHLFSVDANVLIPRPETELLVELALQQGDALGRIPAVLDVGTGSGCIAISIQLARPAWNVSALEISAPALALARANATRLGARLIWHAGDLRCGLPPGQDVVVANPPYIAACDPHLQQGDLRFEPAQALTDGGDGLSLLRRLAEEGPRCLNRGGWLLLEHGYDQAQAVRRALRQAGLTEVRSWTDLAGIERVSGGRLA